MNKKWNLYKKRLDNLIRNITSFGNLSILIQLLPLLIIKCWEDEFIGKLREII